MCSFLCSGATAVSTGFGYAASLFTVPVALGIIAVRRIADFSPRLDPLLFFWAALLPMPFGIRVRVRGGRRFPAAGPLLILANHVNIFDAFVIQGHIPRAVRGLELESHFRWPVYGLAMRLFGNIPIPHRDPGTARHRLGRAGRILERGAALLVFPEGHRTRVGSIGRLMSGPFRLATTVAGAGLRLSVVPMVMRGAYQRQHVGSARVVPGRVDIIVGEPWGHERIRSMSAGSLRNAARSELVALLAPETADRRD